ncbi:hypothetical protein DPX16_3667 [Anabarilius grahami]|uniref:Integrase zinc-binding domain-containing protein n=1 Tax=Anabarilius grahami TaxID=495550 RepID=A0A3N0YGG2_ANAGA|nr:hypothetical protein DPX16_3667 [Anabarilius grahami]
MQIQRGDQTKELCPPNSAAHLLAVTIQELCVNRRTLLASYHGQHAETLEEWAKVIRAIAHNLKLQAEDARRNQAQTQHHHDQRLVEIQDQRWTADESKPELQEELQRLQKALAELHLEVERRELLEKVSREELTGKLQHSEALQAKAETELKDRHTKAMTCENQCKQAQKGVMAPKQQKDYVNELDTGYRVLKSGLGGETHITEFPLTSQEALIPKGVESPLPKTSSGQEPSPAAVKSNCQQLRQAFTQKLSDPASDQRFPAAMNFKRGRLKNPYTCYSRIQRVYYGALANQPACETQKSATPLTANLTADTTTEEPLPRFESKGQQSQKDANALKNDADCQKLRQVLNKFKVTFAKDLLDCGRTKLHQVHSATHPNAPPTFVRQYKNLPNLPITASGLTAAPNHKRLHGINHMLRVGLNILKHVPDDLTTPKLVMSQGQKGGKLIYVHDTPCAKHHGTRTTDETLKQVAHWPSMQQDVAEDVRGCQVCCQVQTANANHRSPLQHRVVTFPWSVNQINWTVELPLMLMAITDTMQGPTRGSPTEPMTAWQVTLPLHLYQPGDSSLITAYSTHQHLNKLRLQLKEQLATQSQTLQTICKYWKGIVVVPCTHSFLLIQTVNSMKQLFTVFQDDFAQNQLVMALMTDLLREVSISMDRVAMNRIPQYPMQTVLDFATGRPTKTVPAHLADSLGAAILLHVDPKQSKVALLLNPPSAETDNIYRPKDKYNTTTRVSLPNPSTWIQVPLGPILHLNRLVAYCLSSEEYQSKLEIPSSSRNYNRSRTGTED